MREVIDRANPLNKIRTPVDAVKDLEAYARKARFPGKDRWLMDHEPLHGKPWHLCGGGPPVVFRAAGYIDGERVAVFQHADGALAVLRGHDATIAVLCFAGYLKSKRKQGHEKAN